MLLVYCPLFLLRSDRPQQQNTEILQYQMQIKFIKRHCRSSTSSLAVYFTNLIWETRWQTFFPHKSSNLCHTDGSHKQDKVFYYFHKKRAWKLICSSFHLYKWNKIIDRFPLFHLNTNELFRFPRNGIDPNTVHVLLPSKLFFRKYQKWLPRKCFWIRVSILIGCICTFPAITGSLYGWTA